MKRYLIFFVLLFSLQFSFGYELPLNNVWYIKKASEVSHDGQYLSVNFPDHASWCKISVPSTVMNCLEKNKVYENVFYGNNLDTISTEQFKQPWWYVTSFKIPEKIQGKYFQLKFEGINYRANVWLNGQKIASSDTLFGSFRVFEIGVTKVVQHHNILAVEVIPPKPGDLTIGFVDWSPESPDRNMGIWRPVKLLVSDAVAVGDAYVKSHITYGEQVKAILQIETRLINYSNVKQKVSLRYNFRGTEIEKKFTLNPNEKKKVLLGPKDSEELVVHSPKLWWPNGLGEPNLHSLKVKCYLGESISDSISCVFGIREVKNYITKKGYRGFKVNGKKFIVKGGGWRDNLFLNEDSSDFKTKIGYIKHMNMNAIRVEGIWGNTEYLYDLCDKNGIIVIAGFSCQWEWPYYLGKDFANLDKHGGIITQEEMDLAVHYMKDQLGWLRKHPSIFAWLPGSDLNPRPELEDKYADVLDEICPGLPYISSAAGTPSEVGGPTGLKMNGPYDYVTPNYWYIDSTRGGAFGFSSESGPGPQLPVMETIRKMIPKDSLWPLDNASWKYHFGRNSFHNIKIFNDALNSRYGKAENISDYIQKAQLMSYEAMRPSFEAYRLNKLSSTGYIHWMINNSWPGTHWQLYDYYLLPNAAFYATKKACAPLSLIYDYKNHNVSLVNDTYKSYKNLKVVRLIYTSNSVLEHSDTITVSINENTTYKVFSEVSTKDSNHVYFQVLQLFDENYNRITDNFYWLSDIEDELSNDTKLWYATLNNKFSDLTYLQKLPKADVIYTFIKNETGEYEVDLKNNSDVIAFFMDLNFLDEKGEIVKPVYWEDNYLSLLPGESRKIIATIDSKTLRLENVSLSVKGVNLR